jgi:hypothetical protein
MYSMYKEDGSCGDSGGMSMAIWIDEAVKENSDKVKYEHNARPRVGVFMRVGSVYARTMQAQDWWQTNTITEILEETENYVKFKTASGSIYEWKVS